MSGERDDQIRRMVGEGATLRQIGSALGVSGERIRQICSRLGLVTNAGSRRGRTVPAEELMSAPGPLGSPSKRGLDWDDLVRQLHYDAVTGEFRWRKNFKVAGSVSAEGYIQIRINGQLFMAHVLAWFYHFKIWPPNEIDHENRKRADNRILNLRVATHIQNLGNQGKQANNTSGFKGVTRHGKKWRAEIAHIKLGTFDTPEAAAEAYRIAAQIRFGEYAST